MARKRSTNRSRGLRNTAARNSVLGANFSRCGSGTLSDSMLSPCTLGEALANDRVRGSIQSDISCCFTSHRNSCAAPAYSINLCRPQPQPIRLNCGEVYNLDLENVPEGDTCLQLARVAVDTCGVSHPRVKIDFSTIIEVEDNNEVELLIALRRNCNGVWDVLETYELEFDCIEVLPFSFTYCDDEICPRGGCIYTVDIIQIEVKCGNRVNELNTASTAISALVVGC